MKSKIYYLLILAFTICFNSCSEGLVELKSEQESEKLEFKEDGYYVSSEGVLYFKNSDAFFSLGERLIKMSNEEFVQWEAQSGFKSLRTELETVNAELDSCKTIEEYNAISEANSDIITVDEDFSVVPVIENPIYQCVINRKGYYFCENRKVKVCKDGVYSTKGDIDVSWNNLEKSVADTSIIKYVAFSGSESNLKSTNAFYVTSIYDYAGWDNRRNAFAKMYIFSLREEGGNMYEFRYYVSCYTISYGRTIIGTKKKYKSNHYCNAFYLNVKIPSYFDAYLNDYVYAEVSEDHPEDQEDHVKEKQWWGDDYDDKAKLVGQFEVSKSTFNAHFPNYYINTASGEFWTGGTADRHIVLTK